MCDNHSLGLPLVTDKDVDWVCDVLELPRNAFAGADGSDPRLQILKSNEILDIEACPGSGKTTLLVAKLAILARQWPSRCRGICVLSHTNAARREIEKRLGNTPEGKQLLSYPHFVGTIHRFVNEYLAIPWLRSKGYPVRAIDNELCEQHRRRLLGLPQFRALASFVKPQEANGKLNVVSTWRLVSPTLDVYPEFKDPTKPAARQLHALGEMCLKDGYYRYEEMFMWARDLLDKLPIVRDALRVRFPMLFIDEVQDNSEEQSALLFRLFSEGGTPVLRQRYGDANQAIYQHATQTEGAVTDQFPDIGIRRDIPNSYRFGLEIGILANPLGLEPQGLVGCGPCSKGITADTSGKHTIFLFDDQTVKSVLSTYGQYLLELFSEEELRIGTFTAVGGVHRLKGDDKLPRAVGHYWQDYDHELTAAEPKPRTFLQYVMAGRKLANETGETHNIVEMIAEGIFRLVRILNPKAELNNRKRKHRYILDFLAEKPENRSSYLQLVTAFAVEGFIPSAKKWNEECAESIRGIAEAIGGIPAISDGTSAFLEWRAIENEDPAVPQPKLCDNMFRYPADHSKLKIRVGSIHSVKGETHTATLVLDTFYYEHHLKTLKPWLLQDKSGKGIEKQRNISRLKQHYVAMTRPSHLLCLAMRKDVFTDEEVERLKSIHWRVARVTDAGPAWL